VEAVGWLPSRYGATSIGTGNRVILLSTRALSSGLRSVSPTTVVSRRARRRRTHEITHRHATPGNGQRNLPPNIGTCGYVAGDSSGYTVGRRRISISYRGGGGGMGKTLLFHLVIPFELLDRTQIAAKEAKKFNLTVRFKTVFQNFFPYLTYRV